MFRLYLAHSAHEKEQGKRIENRLKDMGYDVYNPFDKEGRHEFFSNHGGVVYWEDAKVVWSGEPDHEVAEWIVNVDLEGVRQSDIVVAIYPQNLLTFGITCEHFEAFRHLRMPVYTYTPPEIKGHPWLIAHSTKMFVELEELMNFMGNLTKT